MWKKKLANYQQEDIDDECPVAQDIPKHRESTAVFKAASNGHDLSELLTPCFGKRAQKNNLASKQCQSQNKDEEVYQSQIATSIPEIIKKYKGNTKDMLNEEEFNTVCRFLEIDDADTFDSLIYEFYSKIFRNLNKLNEKAKKSLKEAKSQEYELNLKLTSARIKIDTLIEMDLGSNKLQ